MSRPSFRQPVSWGSEQDRMLVLGLASYAPLPFCSLACMSQLTSGFLWFSSADGSPSTLPRLPLACSSCLALFLLWTGAGCRLYPKGHTARRQ